MAHRIFNASNVLGGIAFLALLAVPGAVEDGLYITAAVLAAAFAGCTYLSVQEDGKKK